jgi:hypothetical protein
MSRRMKQRDEGEMRGANLARIDDGSWRMPTSATERRTDSTRTSRHVRFVPTSEMKPVTTYKKAPDHAGAFE